METQLVIYDLSEPLLTLTEVLSAQHTHEGLFIVRFDQLFHHIRSLYFKDVVIHTGILSVNNTFNFDKSRLQDLTLTLQIQQFLSLDNAHWLTESVRDVDVKKLQR